MQNSKARTSSACPEDSEVTSEESGEKYQKNHWRTFVDSDRNLESILCFMESFWTLSKLVV